jgi:hypothetical protein
MDDKWGTGAGIYWLTGRPRWVQAIVYAGLWAVLWFATFGDDNLASIPVRLINALVAGAAWGAVMVVLLRTQDRRVFGSLTAGQRVEVLRSVDAGAVPADPALGPAAVAVARRRVHSSTPPVVQISFLGGLLLVAMALAIWARWSWWPLAIVYALAIPRVLILGRRQRRGAQQLLASLEGSGPARLTGDDG